MATEADQEDNVVLEPDSDDGDVESCHIEAHRTQTRTSNLPFTITEDKLMDLFVGFGEVSRITLITDKATGLPRGFGFVEMPTQSEAEAAIKGLNGTSIGGRAIQVNIARDRRR